MFFFAFSLTSPNKNTKKKLTNIPPTFLSSRPCLPFGCFIQVIGCIACVGRSATRSQAWVWMQWALTKDDLYCSFLITWHSLDHLDEQGRWFTSSEHFHLFLNSPQYKWHFLEVTGLNLVHTKHFYCKIGKSPLHTGIFNSMCAFEYSGMHKHAHQQSTKPLNWPDQLTGVA